MYVTILGRAKYKQDILLRWHDEK